MPNLKDIRRRIRSVKNMKQITRAMKLVSAAKLRRAQERVVAARPYTSAMAHVLESLASRAEPGADENQNPLLEQRGDDAYLLVLITADKGLCGGFNTNLIRAASTFVRENSGKQISLLPVGRRGRDFFRRRRMDIPSEHVNVVGKAVQYSVAAGIAREIIDMYLDEARGIDKVFLIYSEFRSVLSQQPVVKPLLPIGGFGGGEGTTNETEIDYIYEQTPQEIFESLLPKYIETQIFHAMLESVASEHGARMTAMDAASKNAAEVIDRLTLYANRVRQAAITNEIIEVVSGAQALEG